MIEALAEGLNAVPEKKCHLKEELPLHSTRKNLREMMNLKTT